MTLPIEGLGGAGEGARAGSDPEAGGSGSPGQQPATPAPLSASKPTSIHFQHACSTQPGRKHLQARKDWNEDRGRGFVLSLPHPALHPGLPALEFRVMYVADGHGETPKARHTYTRAEVFMDHLEAAIPVVLEQVIGDAYHATVLEGERGPSPSLVAPRGSSTGPSSPAGGKFEAPDSPEPGGVAAPTTPQHSQHPRHDDSSPPSGGSPRTPRTRQKTCPASIPSSHSRVPALVLSEAVGDIFSVPNSPTASGSTKAGPGHAPTPAAPALAAPATPLELAESRGPQHGTDARLCELITASLESVGDRLNARLDEEVHDVCLDNGSTLVLGRC
jgi:hypothetical protein